MYGKQIFLATVSTFFIYTVSSFFLRVVSKIQEDVSKLLLEIVYWNQSVYDEGGNTYADKETNARNTGFKTSWLFN